MRKEERDRIMMSMSQEHRDDYRRIISEIRSARKAASGRRVAIRALVASQGVAVPTHLREVVEAVIARDETGPKVGEPAPDFCLKRLSSEAQVRLSSFQGQQPVAMVFGSYT
jgi:predicted RNase H-like nuclease